MSSRLPQRAKTDPLPKRIGVFKGDWGFLSNFSPVVVKLCIDHQGVPHAGLTGDAVDIEEYASVEHAYQAAKFLDAKIRERFRLPGMEPGQAKNYAKYLENQGKVRPDWKQVNLEIMRGLLVQKFTYSILRRKLIATFGAELVEGNWWHDNFFGNCLCDECQSILGQNHLGRLLMEIRSGTTTPPSTPSADPSTS